MLRKPLPALFSIALVACGPSVGGEPILAEPELHDTLAERCGSTDPVQLLALAPNETAESNDPWYLDDGPYTSVARHGDRWLLGVKTFEHELIPPSIDPEENVPNELVSSRIVSVDGCGGDVRVVLEGASAMRVPTGDEPWVACSEGMVAFDPDVEGSGRAHPDLHCSTDAIAGVFAALTHEDEDGTQWLARARLAVDEPSDITLLAPHVYEPHVVAGTSLRMFDTHEGELVELDVLTGEQRVLRTNVYSWSASADGRFVEWRAQSASDQAPVDVPLLLWDRQLDVERPLGLPEWERVRTYGVRGNAVAVTPYHGEPDLTQLVLFATGDEIVLEGQWQSLGQVGDTYVLRDVGGISIVFVEPGAEPSPPLHVGTGDPYLMNIVGESLWVLVDEPVDDVDDDPTTPSSSLYELAAPDFTPRLVAGALLHPLRLADGRVLNVTDLDHEHRRGTLVLVDDQGSTELDHHVADALYRFNTSGQRQLLEPLVDDTLVYSVRDPEHERTGVWIAQIAPPPEG